MSTVAQHRGAIKTALASLTGEKFDYERKSFPAGIRWIVSWPQDFNPSETMGDDRTLVYPVRFEIPWDDDESSDAALETAMQSVAAAIHADETLGGVVDSARCLPFTNIGAAILPDETRVMQFVVPVEVYD